MSQHSDVELRLPADSAYVSVIRLTTAGIAARLDFTLDDIEDLRIAVGEACALVLEDAWPDATLECAFDLGQDQMVVRVTAEVTTPSPPDPDSLAWQVLDTLANGASASVAGGRLTISLTMKSSVLA
ncbi:MAG: anti-sigma factor [Actinomycetota bacterium]|nr:anti-sigma factor [Actinomycetota bacterium]